MKKAEVRVHTVFAECPGCGGYLLDPDDDSSEIKVISYSKHQLFACEDCGARWKLQVRAEIFNLTG